MNYDERTLKLLNKDELIAECMKLSKTVLEISLELAKKDNELKKATQSDGTKG